jgi:nicotinate-nucleotide pyrophosphorylase (carboxylating)
VAVTTRPAQPPRHAVRAAVEAALAEDLTPLGDLSAALIPPEARATAALASRATGVFAGRACVEESFAQVDGSVTVDWLLDDGDDLAPGTVVARVAGPLASILTAERTALNFARHLSGVATLTRRFVVALGPDVLVWDTRKTIPGLRSLEKAAVRAGGGANHRGNLSDWVMLKDNHLAVLDIASAVARAREVWPGRTVHVECDTIERAVAAAEAGADALLLDNLGPEDAAKAVTAAREVLGDRRCFIEASGGITLETVATYADTGVDAVSAGALTDSAKALDLGLDVETDSGGTN